MNLGKKIIGVTTADRRKAWTNNEAAVKLYKTQRWRKLRQRYLIDNYECRECRRYGKYAPATVVDHIKPVSMGGEFWDEDNLQPLCKYCHNSKSARERWVKSSRSKMGKG